MTKTKPKKKMSGVPDKPIEPGDRVTDDRIIGEVVWIGVHFARVRDAQGYQHSVKADSLIRLPA